MRTAGPRARRRLRPACQLVDLSRSAPAAVSEELSQAFRVGLCAAAAIYDAFPTFYAESGLDRDVITPELLMGCIAALFQLTEQAGVELRWPGDTGGWDCELTRYECAPTPAETLRNFRTVALSYLSDLAHFVFCPRPIYRGIGLQELLDGESDNYPSDGLTILIWHLFQHTPLGLGVDLGTLASRLDEDLSYEILRIRPLPSDTPLRLTCKALGTFRQGVKAYDLIAYAVGKTENELANHSDYEVEAIYMGELDEDWDWKDMPHMIKLARQAEQIEDAYAEWSTTATSIEELRRIAGKLHRAARRAERELQEPPRTLITLLGGEQLDAMQVAGVEAL